MKRISLIPICLLFFLPLKVSGQEWRGIKLLESNCDDVKRALGVDKCEYPRTTYRLDGENVAISFESCPCPTICGGLRPFNLPRGTVKEIERHLRTPLPITEFDVSSGNWTSLETDFIGHVIYSNQDKGLTLSAVNGGVDTITYYPATNKLEHLRCQNCSHPTVRKSDISSSVFIAYGLNISPESEKYSLNDFVLQLRKLGRGSKAYIVVYNACARPKGEARDRALQAQRYLLAQGIGSRKIAIIDGGYRESMSIELHGRERNMPPPKPRPPIYPPN